MPHLTLHCFVAQDEKRKQLMMHKIILLASEYTSSQILANLECSVDQLLIVYMYIYPPLPFPPLPFLPLPVSIFYFPFLLPSPFLPFSFPFSLSLSSLRKPPRLAKVSDKPARACHHVGQRCCQRSFEQITERGTDLSGGYKGQGVCVCVSVCVCVHACVCACIHMYVRAYVCVIHVCMFTLSSTPTLG